MSYTQFVSTAKCVVADDFDLEEYIVTLSDFISNHIEDLDDGIKWAFEEYTQDDVAEILGSYIHYDGSNVFVECDTEESNSNSEVWDWLIDQVREDVMASKLMEINSATIDSRSGVECGTSFLTKSGKFIGSEDIMELVERSGILVDG